MQQEKNLDSLEDYHFQHNQLVKVNCENCDKPIYCSNAHNAHILPKAIFKSVATNIENHLYLCLPCHDTYDSSWAEATSMKVWPLALSRFKKFENKVLEKEHIVLKHFYEN